MAYRRIGVTVTQQFAAAAPALAAFSLPSVVVGAAFQIVNNDALGDYDGSETAYAYTSLVGGGIVDDAFTDADETFPIAKKEIAVDLKNTVIEVVASQSAGSASGDTLTD